MNRVYNKYYRGRGYDFDITGDGEYDQSFVPNRCVFENINRLGDDIFCSYISRRGSAGPLQTRYYRDSSDDGEGLTAGRALRLAAEGRSALDILKSAFGDDIEIMHSACVNGINAEPPPHSLSIGMSGRDVSDIQRKLNLISTSFPNIPKINPADGMFGPGTEAAVKEFQSTFNLIADGIVGRSTWYRIQFVYNTVRSMLKLIFDRMSIPASCSGASGELSEGDSGDCVKLIQYLLNLTAQYVSTVKSVPSDGRYGRETTESVMDFQRTFGLDMDGAVGRATYNKMYDLFFGFTGSRRPELYTGATLPFPGGSLKFGTQSEDVKRLQEYIGCACDLYGDVLGKVKVTGVFGADTRTAVKALQRLFRLPQTGIVDRDTWDMIAAVCDDYMAGRFLNPGQFPGYLIERRIGREVRL